jgi:NAD(P)-dependent dehydrogenase (short-subunit alcohol dehydrogenase family)
MDLNYLASLFDLNGQVAVITGGGGVLGSAMARALARLGVKMVTIDLRPEAGQKITTEITSAGGEAVSICCDVLDKPQIEAAAERIIDMYGHVDILINAAGGNKTEATTSPSLSFFDLPEDAFRWVFNLNFIGTFFPSQVFGRQMAKQGYGTILNISSMNAFRPLTQVPAYSTAKAAVSNFTAWLAVHMAQEYSPKIRVNALAPGFFYTQQNQYLLTDETTGKLSKRGQQIIDHTPMGRFGKPEDLFGVIIWLLSPSAAFVSGIVVPIDGGFSAYSGV